MKQIIVKATMLLAVLIMSAQAIAYNFTVDGIVYKSLSVTTCEVIDVEDGYEGSIAIPEQVTYNGLTRTVTAIGNNAFRECTGLTDIDIPNSVTSIGYYAFLRCSKLTNIVIPNSVSAIGTSTFSNCN